MADRDLTAALKSAIEIWSFAPSTGTNYLRNFIEHVRWDSARQAIVIETGGASQQARSRAVEIRMTAAAPNLLTEFRDTAQAAAADALVRHVEAALAALAAATEDDDPTGLHTAQWQLRAALDAVKRGGE